MKTISIEEILDMIEEFAGAVAEEAVKPKSVYEMTPEEYMEQEIKL